MQNSEIVASKTEQLFLLPNAAARLKRKNGGFDLTSAGLMSLIAACGGSSGGSADTDTNTDTMGDTGTNTDTMGGTDTTTDTMGDTGTSTSDGLNIYDTALTALAAASGVVNSLDLITKTSNGTHSIDNNNVAISFVPNTETTISLASNSNAVLRLISEKIKDDKSAYETHTMAFKYGNFGGSDLVDLAVGASQRSSDDSRVKGGLAIIWDYDPTDAKFQGKTFNITGGNYTGNTKPDNGTIPHLMFDASRTTGTLGFGANSADAMASVVEIDDKPALLVGNHYRDFLAVVWDVGQYQRGTTGTHSIGSSQTLKVEQAKDTMLIITSDNRGGIVSNIPKALDLGGDGKSDLLLFAAPYNYQSKVILNIIWDIASHSGDDVALSVGDTQKLGEASNTLAAAHNDKFFSIRVNDISFPEGKFSSIDLDGDGSNDLYTDHKDGIIFWGSEIAMRTDLISLADGDGATMFTASLDNGVVTDHADGLWFGGATLEQLAENFYFVDVNDDGIRDAIYKTPTGDDYSVWHLAGTKNVIADATDFSKGFTGITAATISNADLNTKRQAAGIYPDYYRKDFNGDGRSDFIAKTPNTELYEGRALYNVWFAKDDGSLDSAAGHDAYASPPAASSLADGSGAGADMLQLVDIA